MSSKLFDRYIEAHRSFKNTEHSSLEEKRRLSEMVDSCRRELISELEENGGDDVLENFVLQLPPVGDDPDEKPLYLRLREVKTGGSVSLKSVSQTIFGSEEERANPDLDLLHEWSTKIDKSFTSLLEKEEAEKKKEADKAAKKKKVADRRRRTVAQIKKLRAEEDKEVDKAEKPKKRTPKRKSDDSSKRKKGDVKA